MGDISGAGRRGRHDLAGAEEAHTSGHPLDRPAAGVEVGSGGQQQQAGAEAHQHMNPHPIGMGTPPPVMGTVETHRQAAQHRQAHAQQSLQIGHGGEPAQGGRGQEHRQDHHSNQSHD